MINIFVFHVLWKMNKKYSELLNQQLLNEHLNFLLETYFLHAA
jgi:hypothetical protein